MELAYQGRLSMVPAIAPTVQLFKVSDYLFPRALEDLKALVHEWLGRGGLIDG